MATILKMEGITKKFPMVVANDKVTLVLQEGEIHALLGENGAGKSTLMNCLYGMYCPDEGKIFYKGEEVHIKCIEDAIKLGIGMVHQHFMLVPELTVTENIILGLKSKREPFLNLKKAEVEVQQLSDRYNFGIDAKALIKDLPVGMQQRVEIMKILYRKADILILDEPTAVLTPQEVKELFMVINQLSREGKSIIMIVHKLEEVMEVCGTVTTLRDGKVVGTVRACESNPKELAKMMVGREVFLNFDKKPCQPKEVALAVEDLVVTNKHGINMVNGVSFELKKGEILGIAGVDGNGQIELCEAITGLLKPKKGRILIKGEEVKRYNAKSFIERKVSHIPQDRQSTGLVLDFSIKENLILKEVSNEPYSKKGVINDKVSKSHAMEAIEKFHIKAGNEEVHTRTLSGGNQQKVVIAREVYSNPDVLIAVQPTRGLDIGATEFVRKQLLEQRDKYSAVLLVSTELDEILSLSDRIAVMHNGKFMGVVRPGEVTIEEIGLMMAGAKQL